MLWESLKMELNHKNTMANRRIKELEDKVADLI